MDYLNEQLMNSLKEARLQKGLSQRELSARSGVPQSHISKIESGAVDIRVSSLIALARVLDLELELVPKKSIPAVRSIVRSSNNSEISKAQKQVRAQIDGYREIFKALPPLDKDSAENLKKAQSAVDAIARYPLEPTAVGLIARSIISVRAALDEALKNSSVNQLRMTVDDLPSNRLKNAVVQLPLNPLNDAVEVDQDVQKALAKAARQLAKIRNTLAHQDLEGRGELSGPAYSLEGDDDA